MGKCSKKNKVSSEDYNLEAGTDLPDARDPRMLGIWPCDNVHALPGTWQGNQAGRGPGRTGPSATGSSASGAGEETDPSGGHPGHYNPMDQSGVKQVPLSTVYKQLQRYYDSRCAGFVASAGAGTSRATGPKPDTNPPKGREQPCCRRRAPIPKANTNKPTTYPKKVWPKPEKKEEEIVVTSDEENWEIIESDEEEKETSRGSVVTPSALRPAASSNEIFLDPIPKKQQNVEKKIRDLVPTMMKEQADASERPKAC